MPGSELIATPPDEGALLRTVIDDLLEEQQRLTAVDRFSRRHDSHAVPAHSRYYRDLIPRSKPGEGQQYAFAVDMDACTGCKGCVSACHSLNGLDDDELWRNVGLLHSGKSAYQQTITTACHHCVDPACMNGCPVLAYDKDPETGIVRHLDDQCIGCQYCVLKCPYEVPKYSKARGIVRKCDMCSSRLAQGEAPACVQACPNGAITIGVIDREVLRVSTGEDDHLLPGTVSSAYTIPSTTFRSRRPIPADAAAGDAGVFRLQEAHWPLVLMLVLTQMGVGFFGVLTLLPAPAQRHEASLSVAGALLLFLGLAASTFHLGRPLGAWRAFLGFRRSWMSREIVVFGGLAPLAAISAGVHALPLLTQKLTVADQLFALLPHLLGPILTTCTTLVGTVAVYCSAMIYIDTRRPSWAARHTLPRFFGTMVLLGCVGAASVLSWVEVTYPSGAGSAISVLASIAIIARTALFGKECVWFLRAFRSPEKSAHPIARGLWNERRALVIVAAVLFVGATGCGVAALLHTGIVGASIVTLCAALTFLAQICERYFYFVTSVPFKMPGAVPLQRGAHS